MVAVKPETDEQPQVEAKPKPNMFVYTSETPRIYVNLGFTASQGDVREWPDGAPDVCWDAVTDSKEK